MASPSLTREYLDALCDMNSTTEVWERRGFCNNSQLRVLVSGRRRFELDSCRRITKKWLQSKYVQVR